MTQLLSSIFPVFHAHIQPEQLDVDMVVDACLFLWNKCKSVFQRFQIGTTDNHKYLQKMENASKVRHRSVVSDHVLFSRGMVCFSC